MVYNPSSPDDGGGGGVGGTLIFPYMRRLVIIVGVKILSFDIFGGLQKNE